MLPSGGASQSSGGFTAAHCCAAWGSWCLGAVPEKMQTKKRVRAEAPVVLGLDCGGVMSTRCSSWGFAESAAPGIGLFVHNVMEMFGPGSLKVVSRVNRIKTDH